MSMDRREFLTASAIGSLTLSGLSNAGASTTNVSTLTVNLAGLVDATSGIDSVRVSTDPTFSGVPFNTVTISGATYTQSFTLPAPDGAKTVYALLLSYAWHNDLCFPGQDRLARDMGMGIASVNRFVKELEDALARGDADLAVHSAKDVPFALPGGFVLCAFPGREDPRDVLLSRSYDSLSHLPRGARVGTSSLRRQAQLRALRPDLEIHPLRGNVDTRLRKLDEGGFDAIVLAALEAGPAHGYAIIETIKRGSGVDTLGARVRSCGRGSRQNQSGGQSGGFTRAH